jgi:acyl dehydratase
MTRYARLSELQPLVDREIGTSDWFVVDQERIDAFAHATEDRQWIHVDAGRAADGPFGATVAHGFLTLSLLPHMGESAFQVDDVRMGVNYGLDRVRFPSPVKVGSRLRGHFVLREYRVLDGGGAQLAVEVTIEIEGQPKPACVAPKGCAPGPDPGLAWLRCPEDLPHESAAGG